MLLLQIATSCDGSILVEIYRGRDGKLLISVYSVKKVINWRKIHSGNLWPNASVMGVGTVLGICFDDCAEGTYTKEENRSCLFRLFCLKFASKYFGSYCCVHTYDKEIPEDHFGSVWCPRAVFVRLLICLGIGAMRNRRCFPAICHRRWILLWSMDYIDRKSCVSFYKL